MKQENVNKGIDQYVRSVHIQIATVIGLHLFAFTYFFPLVVFTFVASIIMFLVLYKWIELTYQIEQANRDNLIALINATENESTRNILLQELWYADLNSLGGEPEYKSSLTY